MDEFREVAADAGLRGGWVDTRRIGPAELSTRRSTSQASGALRPSLVEEGRQLCVSADTTK